MDDADTVTLVDRTDVVIVGSGFGALATAKKLAKAGTPFVLISETTEHLFQPLLYQVATGVLSPGEIAPSVANRPGGYTRIVRCGVRQGDGAPMCYIELVDREGAAAADAAPAAEAKPKARRSSKKATGEAQPAAE